MSYIVYLEGHDEEYSPPEQLLGVATVGETVFLSIENYEETYDTRSLQTVAQISVNKRDLLAALVSTAEDVRKTRIIMDEE